ncbi:MAG: electron transfer flavoprotein [Clostridia bacterium]|nr:MAG: electron transfer flavoprotein [Clostridia bacterium]
MKYVVCYKLVPNESSIGVLPGKNLDFANCEWEIGQYDLRAVETAARLTENDPSNTLVALTVGDSMIENSKLKKSILARGPHEMLAVKSDKLAHADSFATAEVLTEAIRNIGDVDAVFFGEGSGDLYSQQVGNITGALLGWNTVNAVSSAELDGDCLVIERNLESCTEVLRVSLPAAVSVTSDSCIPRLASMKEILKANKKVSTVQDLETYAASGERRTAKVDLKVLSKTARKCEIISDDEAGISAAAAWLRKL